MSQIRSTFRRQCRIKEGMVALGANEKENHPGLLSLRLILKEDSAWKAID